MPMSEVTYLLTTFANMARSCSSSEPQFIETVALEIFEVFDDVRRRIVVSENALNCRVMQNLNNIVVFICG